VLGFCAAGHARGDDELGLGELYALNVDPAAWGRGAGRALLAAATTWLDARFRSSILWVLEANPRARRLYEARGLGPGWRRAHRRLQRRPRARLPHIAGLRSCRARDGWRSTCR
jgi:ribosomal protein S18 acetylase RimI-like enzyme